MTVTALRPPGLPDFSVPAALEAKRPPERRGIARDQVRLLVVAPDGVSHRRFDELPSLLDPGDILVVNTSATLPAALDADLGDGTRRPVHVASPLDTGEWVVEVRARDNRGPERSIAPGDILRLPAHLILTVEDSYPAGGLSVSRLWRAQPSPAVSLVDYLTGHGRPIRYAGVGERFPLTDYQNVYAVQAGSAEMASAGRPLTEPLLVRLMAAGVTVAPVVLHAGVSSPELHEPPAPERFEVSATTARLVNSARSAGARVVAVGTTVVRALETVASDDGVITAGGGWTSLVLGEQNSTRVVNGLITGLHLPESSHLNLLAAVAGPASVSAAYRSAIGKRYLWHEFGDSMIFLR